MSDKNKKPRKIIEDTSFADELMHLPNRSNTGERVIDSLIKDKVKNEEIITTEETNTSEEKPKFVSLKKVGNLVMNLKSGVKNEEIKVVEGLPGSEKSAEKSEALDEVVSQTKLLDKDFWYTKVLRGLFNRFPKVNFSEDWINRGFDKIAFLNLPKERKEEVVQIVLADSKSDKLYWTEIVLSALIATFGLLQNSVAVIIGAMLIAPLLRPIQGMAFGMATGQTSFFVRSGKLLLNSVFISIGIGLVVTWLTPITESSIMASDSEVFARTAPNLLDLFIAIFSALVALLSLSFSRLSESVAGVAMAASLAPPLVVVGIELSFGNYGLAWGSLFLFLTNLLAILFVGILVFFVYGYSPHQEQNQKNMLKKSGILLLTTLIISVPLLSSLVRISDGIKLETQSKIILEEILHEKSSASKIADLEIKKFDQDEITLSSVIKIPENSEFFEEFKHEIQLRLSQELERRVVLDMEIIRIANIVAYTAPKDDFEGNFRGFFNELFKERFEGISVISQDLEVLTGAAGVDVESWIVKTIISLPPGEAIDLAAKIDFESDLIDEFPGQALSFVWIPVSQTSLFSEPKKDVSVEQKLHDSLTLRWNNFFSNNFPADLEVKDLAVSWDLEKSNTLEITDESKDKSEGLDSVSLDFPRELAVDDLAKLTIKFDLLVPKAVVDLEIIESRLLDHANTFLPTQVTLDYRVLYFDQKLLENGLEIVEEVELEGETEEVSADLLEGDTKLEDNNDAVVEVEGESAAVEKNLP